MCNVNKPWKEHTGCCCEKVEAALKVAGYRGRLPRSKGHIFLTGREYDGPWKAALTGHAVNNPTATAWDVRKAWERAYDQLPHDWCSKPEWEKGLYSVYAKPKAKTAPTKTVPTTRDVYKVRKAMEGLTIGPLDKNTGELWLCCPMLYKLMMDKLYNEETGYEEMYPRKDTLYKRRKFGKEWWKKICENKPAKKREQGTIKDVIQAWGRMYKEKGWDKLAPFDRRGGFNKPYGLFKAKNVENRVRKEKLLKGRPIAPQTKHPMRKLLSIVGRAWSYVTSQLPGDQFVINGTQGVPAFLEKVKTDLGRAPKVKHVVRDIEGCFPNMPQEAIKIGLRNWCHDISRATGKQGVWVPIRSKTKPCRWKYKGKRGDHKWISFDVMLDVMEFALENAYIRMSDGRLLRQKTGIPMGGPLSPAMTIGGCAWMEKEWLTTIPGNTRRKFMARRYMDDILLFYTADDTWEHDRFLADFEQSECYWKPLQLEEGKHDTFLETTFFWEDGQLAYKLKNDNEFQKKIWRYKHYLCDGSVRHKKANLMGTMRKVHKMASDDKQLIISAVDKLYEFQELGYPRSLRRFACSIMARDNQDLTWRYVRGLQ